MDGGGGVVANTYETEMSHTSERRRLAVGRSVVPSLDC